ncbi:MAG: hypothetical protein H6807_15995 [Planctomycetes bacterium]|nr:hypothetical protein [Planctomycetota bacterium]
MAAAGRRLMIGFEGTKASAEVVDLLLESGASAVILFARNVVDQEQVRRLIAELRAAVPWPLIVAVDQEEGAVVRVARDLDVLPGAACLGRTGSEDLARRAGRCSGARMASLGFDLVLAPVIDRRGALDNPITGWRSFGADGELVARLGRAYAEGLEEGGCAACAKHFPGLGPARIDPHLALPEVAAAIDPEPELAPFASLAPVCAAMMTTHLRHHGLDPEVVTFSRNVVDGRLRRGLGYAGAILSDDLLMGGAARTEGIASAGVAAALAGHDLLLVCRDRDAVLAAATALGRGLDEGRLEAREHAASLARIATLARRAAGTPKGCDEDSRSLALEIAAGGLEVQGDRRRIGLRAGDRLRLVDLGRGAIEPAEEGCAWPARWLARRLREGGLEDVRVLDRPDELEGDRFDRLLVILRDLGRNATATDDLRRLRERWDDRIVFILAGPPGDQLLVDRPALLIDPAGARRAQLDRVVELLLGSLARPTPS